MRRATLILFALIGAAGLWPAPIAVGPAAAQVSAFETATIREATDLINNKRAGEAVGKLAPLAATLAGKVEFDFVYGLALLESGKPAEAVPVLRRALTTQSDHLLARAHLGRALAAAGQLEEAKREIETVRRRRDLPADMRAVMNSNLKRIDEALKQRAAGTAAQPAGVGPRMSDADAALVRTAAELIAAKKAAEALAKLEPLAERLAGNPDFDYVYGVAALDSGRPAQAATALRRAITARPDFHVARAELGRALAAMGDLAGAKREFEAVRNVAGLPAAARDAMGRQVTAIDQAAVAETGTKITGYIEHSVGHDTNVNSGPATSTLLIPALAFLGPATITPSALPKESGFYEVAAGLSVVKPLGKDTALFMNMVGNYHPLFDHQEFRTGQVGGEAGIAHQVGDLGVFSAAVVGQTFWIDDEVFRHIYGVAGQWRRKFAETWDTSIAVSWLGFEYPNTAGQDADRYTVTAVVGRRFEDVSWKPAISLIFNVGKELARTDGNDHLSFTLAGVRGSLELTLTPKVIAFVQAAYEYHHHDSDFPLFTGPRIDDMYEVLGGLEIKLTEKMSLRPSVRWSQTQSKIDLFDQERWISAVALRQTF